MNTLRSVIIALTIFSLFSFGMVNSSEAQIEIVDMYIPYEIYDNIFYSYVYIETDIAYDSVYWYIGDPEDPENLQYVGETLGVDGANSAYFYLDVEDCPGHINGTKYRIAAKVWYYNRDTKTSTSDYETRDFTAYKPEYKYTPVHEKKLDFAHGYVEISKHTYDYDSGYMLFGYYVFANHHGEEGDRNVSVETEYKASFPALPHTENKDWRPNAGRLESSGSWYERSFYASGSIGTTLDGGVEGEEYDGEAYVRLKLSGKGGIDDYWLTNILECEHN